MLKDHIVFISAQPDELHFVWQTQVYLRNYQSLGIPMPHCVALFGVQPGATPSTELTALLAEFPEADLRILEDTRDAAGRAYPPSIQPHLIGKALLQSPQWEGALSFFQDCDIAFRRLPDFDRMLREHPRACLLSDTINYIGYEHLHQCCEHIRAERPEVPEDELIHKMCAIVGIDIEVVRRNEACSGGAQYLLQGVGRDYWQKVYQDSIAIRQLFDEYLGGLGLAKPPGDYVQIWTAGMWAYLWNLWRSEHRTVVHPEMNFLFGNAASDEPGAILHMAGLHDDLKHSHYDKLDWVTLNPVHVLQRQAYLFDHLPETSVAREYADLIHQAAGITPRGLQPLTPASRWRLLTWKGESDHGIWDVQRLHFQFQKYVEISGHVDSNNAGPGYFPSNAFDDSDRFWGGRAEQREDCRPCLYLGVELSHPAVPRQLRITQADGHHRARIAILQFANADSDDWTSTLVARLDPNRKEQLILFHADAGYRASGWRLLAQTTSSGFAWDVHRLALLRNAEEESGTACSSGFAIPETPEHYGAQNAFNDRNRHWGGRRDEADLLYIGIESAGGLGVNRIRLEQGHDHWTRQVEIQVIDEDGHWRTRWVAENLSPGMNDILLFDEDGNPGSFSMPGSKTSGPMADAACAGPRLRWVSN